METSGGFDSDSEMFVYSGSLDMSINFDKKKVNIYDIQKYLSSHVFVDSFEEMLAYNAANPQQTHTADEGGKGAKILDFLAGDDFSQKCFYVELYYVLLRINKFHRFINCYILLNILYKVENMMNNKELIFIMSFHILFMSSSTNVKS